MILRDRPRRAQVATSASGAAWGAWVTRIAPGLGAASEEKSFMVGFVSGLHATAELAREEGLPLLSNDQSDDRSAVLRRRRQLGRSCRVVGSFVAPQGVSTETEPSARDIAIIIAQIKKEKIPAIFLENVSDPRLMGQIASETGAAIGGTLYSDSLTKENAEAPSYIEMVRHNIRTIASALAN
jgi:hypothetical protein